MIFFKIIFVDFFKNIELVKNYNYNKAKSYGESIVTFFTKHSELLQYFCSFPHKTLSIATTFFLMGFFSFQDYLCWFFFFNVKLVENLAL